MNTFNQLEEVWKIHRKVALPDASEIIIMATREKNALANKILLQVLMLALAIVAIGYVLINIHFLYISSYVGLGLMFVCVLGFSLMRVRQVRFLSKADISAPPAYLLKSFTNFYVEQIWLNSVGILMYTCILNLAFALYFYEMIIMAPLNSIWKVLILTVYITWMLIATLYIGRRNGREEQAKTMAVIQKLRQIKGILETD